MRQIPSPLSGFASPFGRALGISILALFAAGEQGILIDPSDLSTLFTDTAGTAPVTAPGQTVARVNDKSGRGNHLTQAVAAARPIYGRHPAGGIRNRLSATEDLTSAYWSKVRAIVTDSGALDTITAIASGLGAVVLSPAIPLTGTATVQAKLKAGTVDWVCFRLLNAAQTSSESRWFNLATGVAGASQVSGGGLSGTPLAVSNEGNGVYQLSFSAATNDTGLQVAIVATTGNLVFNANSGDSIQAGQVQLNSGGLTAYQRVGAPSGLAFPQPQSYDITEAGQPSLHYLFCDGLARWMVSPTITPGTDKVQTWAGVRKLSDASRGTIASFSPDITANNGAFALTAPAGASATFSFESKGTTLTDAVGTFAAPTTRVVAGLGDIAGDRSTLRVNGAQVDQDTGDQGTGNYLAYQLFLGARGGTANYLNGLVYSFVARFGPNLPDATIQQAERWTAQRAGVTLP